MFCGRCGQEVKENCRFCPNCGNEIQKEVKRTYKNLRRGIFGIISILFVMTAVMVGKSMVGKSAEEKIAGIVVQLSRHKFNIFIMNRYM